MPDDRTARIKTAADAILEHCLTEPAPPRAILAKCIGDLNDDPSWMPEDIELVRAAVERELASRRM